ncbi:pol-like protein [Lasius niger]|uniref:Pol-like protein n=1 Tax=Lasius niger TaxID=67767 RepID=A0A0J7N9M9_LASNI|nr:pol-like protein [Lasius niger]
MISKKNFCDAFDKIAPPGPAQAPLNTEALLDLPFYGNDVDISFMFTPFNASEYEDAITSLKLQSAPGPDLISNRIIKKFPAELHSLILKIFNLMFNKSKFSKEWNDYFVFIPKPGKKGALRLIAMSNNLHKIFEKLIHKRLEWWADNNNILPRSQFGFRRGLSCIDNIATLITDIRQANCLRKFTGVVFLDLIGAFDNVFPEVLFTLLTKYGLPLKILKFIKATMAQRNLTGYAAGIALQKRTTNRGLPQGSILSPILFNLYLSLIETSLPVTIKVLIYTDDIAIYCTHENLEHIRDQLNNALDGLQLFLNCLGLSISPSKSAYNIFSTLKPRNLRMSLRRCRFSLNILDECIPFSWSIRFLGVYLDPELNWRTHVSNLRNRIIPRINVLKAISGIRWGAHPATLLTIYEGFIRSVLDWGCQIYHPLSDTLYLKVCRLQFASLRAVSGMMRTTSTNVLLDLNGEQPLKTRWQFLLDKFICKITARLSHPLNSTLLQTCHLRHNERTHLGALVNTYLTHLHIFKQIEQFHLPGYLEFPYLIRHFKPSIDTDSGFLLRIKEDIGNDITEAFNSLLQEQNTDATYYTDCSRACVDGQYRTGFAVFSPETDFSLKKRINNHSSMFEAEALAIEEALRIIIDKRNPKSIIFSDSLSVLTNLQASALSDNSNYIISRIKKSIFSCSQLDLLVKFI